MAPMDEEDTRDGNDYLATARALAPQIAVAGEWGDRERRLPPALVAAMAEAGLFRMVLSPAIGGGGASLPAFLQVVEVVSHADGSAGWCLVQGALSAAQVAPYLPLPVAREIFDGDPHAVLANGTGPSGRAVVVDGGYRLSGEWPFASGCAHATWFKGASLVYQPDGSPVRHGDGTHDHRTFLFPAGAAEIVDVWHVSGLRGTGSNTIRVANLWVPQERTVCLTHDPLQERCPLAALPYSTLAAAGFCAVALGIARGALDAFLDLAAAKTPRGTAHPLREDAVVQAQIARAEAQLRAARAFLYEASEEAWETVVREEALTRLQRAVFRLSATSGIHQAAEVVDTAYHLAGATAIFESQPFERRFRDVHAVTQQVQANPRHFQATGRVFLGLDASSNYV
jgi:alkylation response protein AidB-like acyl-CoA dehydrogenase